MLLLPEGAGAKAVGTEAAATRKADDVMLLLGAAVGAAEIARPSPRCPSSRSAGRVVNNCDRWQPMSALPR